MPEHQIESEFFKVTYYNFADDKRHEMFIANAAGESYGILDIVEQAKEWLDCQDIYALVVGIEELVPQGFCIVDIPGISHSGETGPNSEPTPPDTP